MAPYRETPFDPEAEEGGDVVAVASYSTPVEAELSREHLAENGINAVVQEGASFNPMVSVAAGGTRLLVRSADEGRARHLLRRLAKAEPQEDDEPGEVRCPRCEQTYCTFGTALATASTGAAIPPLFLMFLLPLGLTRKRWRCQRCEHVWDDPEEGPKKRTPLHPDDPQPVFRLRRRKTGTGLLLGVGVSLLSLALASQPGAGAAAAPLVVIGCIAPILGFVVGRRMYTDVCSNPDCRAVLAHGAKDCRGCHGAIAGDIQSANQHWSEAAAVRRELWALRAEKESAPKKALTKKKRPRKKAADATSERPPTKAPPEDP